VLAECRLVGPIAAVWFAVWLPVFVLSSRATRFSAVRECTLLTICCVGIASTVMWCCLYGSMSLRRVAAGLLLIVGTSTFAATLASQFQSNGVGNRSPILIIGVFFVALLAFGPGWCMRRFLRWQICPFSELTFEHDHRFRIQELFYWTAGAALLLALFPMFDEVLFSQGGPSEGISFVAYIVAMTILIPTVVTLVYFTLLSRLSIPYLVIAIPILAGSAGLANALLDVWLGSGSSVVQATREFVLPVTLSFALAGYLILGMVYYLRRKGLYFKVGLVDHRACARLAKQEHDSLRRRISSSTY